MAEPEIVALVPARMRLVTRQLIRTLAHARLCARRALGLRRRPARRDLRRCGSWWRRTCGGAQYRGPACDSDHRTRCRLALVGLAEHCHRQGSPDVRRLASAMTSRSRGSSPSRRTRLQHVTKKISRPAWSIEPARRCLWTCVSTLAADQDTCCGKRSGTPSRRDAHATSPPKHLDEQAQPAEVFDRRAD